MIVNRALEQMKKANRNRRPNMELVLVLLLALIVLDLAAGRWGVNSTEDFKSPEWNRRNNWGTI
jgi:hypothetical protein